MKTISLIIAAVFCCPIMADERALLEILAAKAESTPAEASGDSTPVTPSKASEPAPPLVAQLYSPQQTWKQTGTRRIKQCVNGVCSYRIEPVYGWVTEQVTTNHLRDTTKMVSSAADDATPLPAAKRMLEFMRSASRGTLLDLGSGDGRMVVEWARWTGYPAIGIESDSERVKLSRAFAERKGVSHLVTIVEADFTTMELPKADIVFLYQFDDVLRLMRDKLADYDLVVTYAHRIPGLPMTSHNSGEFFSWTKSFQRFRSVVARTRGSISYVDIPHHIGGVDEHGPFVWYHGRKYHSIGSHRCGMCNYIRSWLDHITRAWRAAQGAY